MKKKILVIGFDWRGFARRDPGALLRKLARDRIDSDRADVLLWEFAPTAGELRLADGKVRVINREGRFPSLRPFYDSLAPFLLVRDLKRAGFVPDVVIIYDFPLLPAAESVKRAFGTKVVLYLTNLPTDLAKTRKLAWFKGTYHRFFERRTGRIVDAIVAINETTRAYACSLGVPDERVFVSAPDTISADMPFIRVMKKGVVHARFSIPDTVLVLFSVGRLEPEKGFDSLIRAFAGLKRADIALVIAGEGRLRSELETLAQEKGVASRVHFAGSISREEIWNYYADADVFILLSRSEALGLVVWEAMYAGVPVIVSGAGGLAESVGADGERGFLWTPGNDLGDLSQKLDRCLDSADAQPMLERARAYVESRLRAADLLSVLSLPAS